MSNTRRAVVAFFVGVFALASLGYFVSRKVSDKPPPTTARGRAFATGEILGSVAGYVIGSAVFALMLRSVYNTTSRSDPPESDTGDREWGRGRGRRAWDKGRGGRDVYELDDCEPL